MAAALAAIYQETRIRIDFRSAENGLMSKSWPNSRALRKYRFSETGRPYLITTCCRDREPVFSDIRLGEIVADEIRISDCNCKTYTFAFVVMPDHLHWLFELRPRHDLSEVVRCLKGRSSYRVNTVRQLSGAIWQTGFHDRAVRAGESLETLGNYIIQNPVRAGLVRNVDDYPLWNMMWRRG
ncbi:MAG: transposase [Woeseiaceae bacterium]|nr:transposase [Woeseiaceae bacterium]